MRLPLTAMFTVFRESKATKDCVVCALNNVCKIPKPFTGWSIFTAGKNAKRGIKESVRVILMMVHRLSPCKKFKF